MRVRQRLLALVGPWAGALSLSLLARTLSIRREEVVVEARRRAGLPTIYAAWHGRLALMPWLYGQRDLHVLISRSRDGEIVAALIRRFGFVPVRGSSSRGGAQGFRALLRALAAGHRVRYLLQTTDAAGGSCGLPNHDGVFCAFILRNRGVAPKQYTMTVKRVGAVRGAPAPASVTASYT